MPSAAPRPLRQCLVCLDNIEHGEGIRLECGHDEFHHECIIEWCKHIRAARNRHNWTVEHCPKCRTFINSDMTRISGMDATGNHVIVLVDRDNRASMDNAVTWSGVYDNPDAIIDDFFGKDAVHLMFERYSFVLDRALYFSYSKDRDTRLDLIHSFTFYPQDHEDDALINRLIDTTSASLHVKTSVTHRPINLRFWLSLLWSQARAVQ